MSNLDAVAKIKKTVASLQRDADRAEASLEILHAQLASEFGCESIDDAKDILERLTRKESKLRKKLKRNTQEFEDKWKDLL